mgnify:CR=1 FL=1
MSDTHYTQVFSGSFILVRRIVAELEAVGITPIIKDEGESQRLAGYASLNQGIQEVVVQEEEKEKAMEIIQRIQSELDTFTES